MHMGRLLNAVSIAGLVLTGVLIFLVITRVTNNGDQINRNQQALAYICSTTSILDALVVQVRDQIDGNFENGTYEKLLRQGIYTSAAIEEAHTTRHRYQQAHLKLEANGACKTIKPK